MGLCAEGRADAARQTGAADALRGCLQGQIQSLEREVEDLAAASAAKHAQADEVTRGCCASFDASSPRGGWCGPNRPRSGRVLRALAGESEAVRWVMGYGVRLRRASA